MRRTVQHYLFELGSFQQRHCGKVLLLGIVFLSLFCIGLKTVELESDTSFLWVEGMSGLPNTEQLEVE